MCVCVVIRKCQMLQTHSEEPEDVVLLLAHSTLVSITRHGIAKQPEAKGPSKYVNIFLERANRGTL